MHPCFLTKTDIKLKTEKGTAVCQKTDIFKGHLWYAYEGEWMNWHKITTEQANEIIALNKKGECGITKCVYKNLGRLMIVSLASFTESKSQMLFL